MNSLKVNWLEAGEMALGYVFAALFILGGGGLAMGKTIACHDQANEQSVAMATMGMQNNIGVIGARFNAGK